MGQLLGREEPRQPFLFPEALCFGASLIQVLTPKTDLTKTKTGTPDETETISWPGYTTKIKEKENEIKIPKPV